MKTQTIGSTKGKYEKKRKTNLRRKVTIMMRKLGKLSNAFMDKKDVKWYWDVRKWSPIILLALILCFVFGSCDKAHVVAEVTDPTVVETQPVQEETEAPTTETTEPQYDPEAVALAILADSSASGKSDEVKEILMWVVINRVEDRSNGYGGSLMEEISRPKQWQEYNPDGMYLQSTYDIALRVLNTWKNNGPRPIYNDMLWSVYNPDGSITVRNKFNSTKNRTEQTFGDE